MHTDHEERRNPMDMNSIRCPSAAGQEVLAQMPILSSVQHARVFKLLLVINAMRGDCLHLKRLCKEKFSRRASMPRWD